MTSWWNNNAEKRIDDFKGWVEDHNQPTKAYCRKYVADKKYTSIIDCGCGLATEYFGYKNDCYDIDYTGLDSCKYFIDTNIQNGIKMIEAEIEGNLPIENNSYDCVFCRDVLEHLCYYDNAINEFIRIGKKEVIISFFIKPDLEEDQINYWEEEDLYHNKYNIEKLQKFILDNPKVNNISWNELNEKGNVLHILLKE